MVRARDVPADRLIQALAENLKKVPGIEPLPWAQFVKTGSQADRPPEQPAWWYDRAASILRKVYFHGPLGVNELESMYGGSKAVGYNPKHHRDAGSSIIRNIIHQLEQAEFISKQGNKGRVLTPKGVALLDKLSNDIFREISEENPALVRYG